MKQTTNPDVPRPSAFITRRKQRIKQFNKNVYLDNGDEYEIELFNPLTEKVLAKIKLDGEYMNGGGIILRPGERIFLERYLDTDRKIKFTTYDVNGKNREVQRAIQNNGKVEIEFFKTQLFFSTGSNLTITNPWYYDNGIRWYSHNTNGTGGLTFGSNSTTTSHITCNNSSSSVDITPTSLTVSGDVTFGNVKLETGRSEKGSKSDQKFKEVDENFSSLSFHTVKWKISPSSQKQYTSKELNVRYCGQCGSKRKKETFKFCPHCGSKY